MKAVKDRLVKQLSKQLEIDPRVVRLIVDYPIKFYRRKAADDTDKRPVRIRYFGVFAPKTSYLNREELPVIAKEIPVAKKELHIPTTSMEGYS